MLMNVKTWFFVSLLLLNVAYAQYYADVSMDVSDAGSVEIKGDSNYEKFNGTTNAFTSKHGENWTFALSEPLFDEYICEIILPKYATINSIKTNVQTKIEERNGRLVITVAAIESEIDVNIIYSIDKTEPVKFVAYYIIGFIFVVFGSIYLKLRFNSKKTKLDRKKFTDRQWDIVSYLIKHGTVTQAQIEKELNLPKSSLSRNIKTLVQKGTLFKETKGMSNVIGLKIN